MYHCIIHHLVRNVKQSKTRLEEKKVAVDKNNHIIKILQEANKKSKK